MRHLKIQHIGNYNVIRASWPMQRYTSPLDHPPELFYEHAPILQIEIDEASWKEMYELYCDHIIEHKHPAVKDAWDKFQMVKALVK